MTTNWKPSEAILDAATDAYHDNRADYTTNWLPILIKRIRPLIIAEEQPKIEAAERERVLDELAQEAEKAIGPYGKMLTTKQILALKDSKP